MDKEKIRQLVQEVLAEYTGAANWTKEADASGILSIRLPQLDVDESHRLDTGNPQDKVYCRDLVTLEESPRLGCGLMVMEDTTFNWHLGYDEVDYMIEGQLDILIEGRKISAGPGEILFIPKDSSIQFSVQGMARFLYVTYPADWQ